MQLYRLCAASSSLPACLISFHMWDVTKTKMGAAVAAAACQLCLAFGGVSPVTHNLTHFLSLVAAAAAVAASMNV